MRQINDETPVRLPKLQGESKELEWANFNRVVRNNVKSNNQAIVVYGIHVPV